VFKGHEGPFFGKLLLKKTLFCPPVSATHKETKQFFTLYNTLDDKKVYLEKEVSNHSSYLLPLWKIIANIMADSRRIS